MSYSLDLYFEPAIDGREILRYLAARRHFKDAKDGAFFYENPHTGVYFWLQLRCTGNILLQRKVVSAEFELNYNRPSYFATEAEIELSALVTTFKPRIVDGQMHGMGDGPYSREGFLNGWNFGNLFSIGSRLSNDPDDDIPSMPTDTLNTTRTRNYNLAERYNWFRGRCVVPTVKFIRIDGRIRRAIVWPQGEAVLLPQVDHVWIGRLASGEPRFGLAPWSEVTEVIQRAGLDTTKDPVELDYVITPAAIAEWVANIDLIEPGTIRHFDADRILDAEVIAAARAIERDENGVWIMPKI